MLIIAILSEDIDFIDSLSKAISIECPKGVKFIFHTDKNRLYDELNLEHLPELVLLDENIKIECRIPNTLKVGRLVTRKKGTGIEVYKYAPITGFVDEIYRTINHNGTTLAQGRSASDDTKRFVRNDIWLLDPFHTQEGINCYEDLLHYCYTNGVRYCALNLGSIKNNESYHTNAQCRSISDLLFEYWMMKEEERSVDKSSEMSRMDYIQLCRVNHFMDLLRINRDFLDAFISPLKENFAVTLTLSGVLEKDVMNYLMSESDRVLIFCKHEKQYEDCEKIMDWIRSRAPHLKVEIIEPTVSKVMKKLNDILQ